MADKPNGRVSSVWRSTCWFDWRASLSSVLLELVEVLRYQRTAIGLLTAALEDRLGDDVKENPGAQWVLEHSLEITRGGGTPILVDSSFESILSVVTWITTQRLMSDVFLWYARDIMGMVGTFGEPFV